MIDGGSCINIIVKLTVDRMYQKAETHPKQYKVTWVDKNVHSVAQRCLMSIQLFSWRDCIWCDVLPMDATLLAG